MIDEGDAMDERPDERPTATGDGPREFGAGEERLISATVLGLAAFVAWIGFRQAVVDFHYQLAGLADPFLGRPAPGMTIALSLIGALLYAIAAWIVRFLYLGPAPRPRRRFGTRSPRWWWVPVAFWAAYAAGAASVVAAGGSSTTLGTVTFHIGAPLGIDVSSDAVCTSAPGGSRGIATVTPTRAGLPILTVRDPATGEPLRYPVPGAVLIQGRREGADRLDLPGIPARPEHLVVVPTRDWGQTSRPIVEHTGVGFLDAYTFTPTGADVAEATGSADFSGLMEAGPFTANGLIPEDPWPSSFELTASWDCASGGSGGSGGPAASAGSPDGSGPVPVDYPSPSWPPSIAVAGAGTPFEVVVATSSDWATLTISGARFADVRVVDLGGPGNVSASGSVAGTELTVTVRQPAPDAARARVTRGIVAVRLLDATAGTALHLAFRCGSTGEKEAQLRNVMGGDPVIVQVLTGDWRDQLPVTAELTAEFILEPVAIRRWR